MPILCFYLGYNQPQKHLLMRNNILGGLVIFLVVVTCLIMIDDISNQNTPSAKDNQTSEIENEKNNETDLAIVEFEE